MILVTLVTPGNTSNLKSFEEENILKGRDLPNLTKVTKEHLVLLRILSPVPSFVLPDLTIISALEPEDIVSLPKEVYYVLIKRKVAEAIGVEND